ncbi:MAG: PQQ-dependent sugar dehydrogenase [Parasphingorhabdus sp.]|nr:PQQ-dependent sugar dehydrogenase [Parasphingorhabdus sp.]
MSVFTAILISCSGAQNAAANKSDSDAVADISPVDRLPFERTIFAKLDEPWAMAFLPDGKHALITEKKGKLLLWQDGGEMVEVAGVPAVDYGGQGGFGDIVLAPDYATSATVYLSWIEAGEKDTRGAVVAHARLILDDPAKPRLEGLKIIWKQDPKVAGRGHYSHRIVFSPDGKYMFIGSGERQKFDPAQDMSGNLGKILRLFPDGSVPQDNPFVDQAGANPQIWSLGHRNILGLAFDSSGQLWNQEMGPKGGDELNLVKRAANYGYPIVSNGDHYDGRDIPDHDTRPEFEAPKVSWSQVISPAGLMFYSGKMFPKWQGSAFIGGLSSQSLVRISFGEDGAREAERFKMNVRIREVEQGPDGAIWLLEESRGGGGGALVKLTPTKS